MPRSASIATIICALLAAFAWQQAAAEEVQAVRFPHRELSCLQLVLEARALLATYDRLLADVPLTDRPPIFIDSLSEMRQDLLMKALSAWYFVGPKPLPADDRAVLAVLGMQGNDYAWFQMPESLDELVQFGYLPHLPESPAGVAEDYISALPEGREAAGGSILYLPLRAAEPYMCAEPGMIEGWVLASFAVREQNYLPRSSRRSPSAETWRPSWAAILPTCWQFVARTATSSWLRNAPGKRRRKRLQRRTQSRAWMQPLTM